VFVKKYKYVYTIEAIGAELLMSDVSLFQASAASGCIRSVRRPWV